MIETMEEKKLHRMSGWGLPETERPFIIAGPCSAETEEQVVKTAIEIAKNKKVDAFRAGIWKPRTRPNTFEGVGSVGLQWLKTVKQETGLMTSTEVANVKHVYEALKSGIDILWIGARTSANPFAVQEIADALQGVDMPIFVKNPVNPDLELWIGAMERIANAGISRIGAIHRGFSSYEKSPYRNVPQWAIPIELRRRMPDLPIICDPSHIAGKRDLIYEIAQKALDLNHDGLIIETHIDPDSALSDAKQQVTPQGLVDLLTKIVLRDPQTDNPEFIHTLEELRSVIDKLDDQILELMSERMSVSKKIGQYKKENNITILQSGRWSDIIKKVEEKGTQKGLSNEFVDKLFKAIHLESINHQLKVMNPGT